MILIIGKELVKSGRVAYQLVELALPVKVVRKGYWVEYSLTVFPLRVLQVYHDTQIALTHAQLIWEEDIIPEDWIDS